jgi:rod shape determining protein RodA
LAGATLAVAGLGVLMVFSATRAGLEDTGADPATYLKRQVLFLAVGCGVAGLTAMVDYRTARNVAPVLYVGVLALLVGVISPLGTAVNGSQSWFAVGPFQLQPAEFGKVAVILMVAAFCAIHPGELDLRRMLVALVLVGMPAGLILLQPDLGSALVYAAIVMGMLLVAGARPRHIVAVTLLGSLAVAAAFSLGVVELEEYQKDRFSAFLDSGSVDERGAGYTQEQSKRAIGNGGLAGRGLLEGSQTRLGFVPEQQTDFIFTVVGEELGFVGSATLLLLYGIMAWRIWHAARVARDALGTLICAGVLAMVVFQVFQSVGMATGIMPVTGIPLPLLSYGGSSLLTMAVAVGLVLNVHMRRYS